VTSKKFKVGTQTLEATWGYHNEGRMTSVVYPNAGLTYNFTYNSMGRPSGMTQPGGGTLVKQHHLRAGGRVADHELPGPRRPPAPTASPPTVTATTKGR
jgi:YD repeat-containing protein